MRVPYVGRAYGPAMTSHTAHTARWSKSSPSWGSALRIQRNYYAFSVTMVMTGGRMECPACDAPLDLDTAEVDRTVPADDYAEGRVVYVCRGCNQSRASLQSFGRDWQDVAQYVSDVESASAHVAVPTMREAREWWNNRPSGGTRVSRYA